VVAYARRFESTDDAQIEGHINLLSSRVSGTVLYVNPKAENNQYVEAGTLLVELDSSDYQTALEHAGAIWRREKPGPVLRESTCPSQMRVPSVSFAWRRLHATRPSPRLTPKRQRWQERNTEYDRTRRSTPAPNETESVTRYTRVWRGLAF